MLSCQYDDYNGDSDYRMIQRSSQSSRRRKRGQKRRRLGLSGLAFFAALFSVAVFFTVVAVGRSQAVQRLFYPLKYEQEIVAAAQESGAPPALIAAVVKSESSFNPQSRSDVGALGLMQIMPETAQWAAEKDGVAYSGNEEDLFDPTLNLRIGSHYLAWLLERFNGDFIEAVAAYNVGQHKVDSWIADNGGALQIENIPYPETRHFTAKVIKSCRYYRNLYPQLNGAASLPIE